jgi:hypothetical protein
MLGHRLDGGRGIDGQADGSPSSGQFGQECTGPRYGFDVDDDPVGARRKELRGVLHGIINHQVDINGQVGQSTDGRDQRHAVSQIRDEMTIHNVEMHSARTCLLETPHFALEITEIALQQRWQYDRS